MAQSNFRELSVFTPNYNHAAFLEKKIEQIVNQSVLPFEYIIIDDGSQDESWKIIEKYQEEYYWIKSFRNQENKGISYNLAASLEICSGTLYYSTASDDVILPGTFERLKYAYQSTPDAGIFFGKMQKIDADGKILDIFKPSGDISEGYIPPESFYEHYLSNQTARFSLGTSTIYNKSCLKQVGGYPSTVNSWQDTLVTWMIAIKYGAYYINQAIAGWRVLPNSLSDKDNQSLRTVIENVINSTKILKSFDTEHRIPTEFVHIWAKDYLLDTATENFHRLKKQKFSKEVLYNYLEMAKLEYSSLVPPHLMPSKNLDSWFNKYSKVVNL
jgi:glycosyltransferase involved in cell wall biosynthesis